MLKKLGLWLGAGFVLYYIIVAPTNAAHTWHGIEHFLGTAAAGIVKFLGSI